MQIRRKLTQRDIKERELLEKYDYFYKSKTSVTTSCMCFGFEVGDGWIPLLEKLSEDIDRELKKNPCEFQVTQVKQKFGGLRYYYSGGNEAIAKLVDKAERDSYKICERCGSRYGVKATKGWITMLCKECHGKNK